MRHVDAVGGAFVLGVGLLLAGSLGAAEWPDACQEAALPVESPDDPGTHLIVTCLPARFNGTLLIYAHGYVRPREPLALPKELAAAEVGEVIGRLLDLGFGVATSSYHKNGYAVEQAEADLNQLVEHVKSSEPGVEAVYVIGASEGGLTATMLVEKYPETYAGGLALCGPLAGVRYHIGYLADVRVLFDYFYPEVFPDRGLFPFDVPDDAHEQWDGVKARIAAAIESDPGVPRAIAQVFDVAGVACDASDPGVAANCAQDILAYGVLGTNDLLDTAGGWPVSNVDKEYRGSSDDAALNAGVQRFDADAPARAYTRRYYRPKGSLQRPLVTLHTTGDPGVPFRHEIEYFKRAALRGNDDLLTVLPVERAGHCEFTAPEILGGLAALLFETKSDLVLALVEHLDTLQNVVDVGSDLGAGTGRIVELVRNRASDFVGEIEDEFGFLDDTGDAADGALDTVKDFGDDAKDKIEDLF